MQPEAILAALLVIAIGGAWAFYGLSAFKILLPIWAFVFGFLAGAQFSQDIFGQGFLSSVFSWGVGAVVGLVLSFISYISYYIAVTIAAGALGYLFGVGILDAIGFDSAMLGIVVGLAIGGVLAAATFLAGVPVFLVIAFSAISGSAGVVNGALILLGRIKLEDVAQPPDRRPPDRRDPRGRRLDRPLRRRDLVPAPQGHRNDAVGQ